MIDLLAGIYVFSLALILFSSLGEDMDTFTSLIISSIIPIFNTMVVISFITAAIFELILFLVKKGLKND